MRIKAVNYSQQPPSGLPPSWGGPHGMQLEYAIANPTEALHGKSCGVVGAAMTAGLMASSKSYGLGVTTTVSNLNNLVNFPNAFMPAGAFTVMGCIRTPTTLDSGGYFMSFGGNSSGAGYGIAANATGLQLIFGAVAVYTLLATPFAVNEEYVVVVTCLGDGTTATGYVYRKSTGTLTTGSATAVGFRGAPVAPLTIGAITSPVASSNAGLYTGQTGSLAVWSRALQANEVTRLTENPYALWNQQGDYPNSANADLSITLGATTVSADATHPDTANATPTLGALTLSAAGSHPDTADASLTLGAVTTSAAATHPDTADASLSIASVTLSSAATNAIVASASVSIAGVTVSSAGTHPVTADASQTMGAVTVSAAGTHPDTADLSKTLGTFTVSAAGSLAGNAALSSAIAAITLSSTAANTVTANASPSLSSVTLAASAVAVNTANSTPTLGAMTVAAVGTHPDTADLSATLSAVTVASAATHPDTVDEAGAVNAVSVASAGVVASTAQGITTMAAMTLSAAGTHADTANASITLQGVSVSATSGNGLFADAAIPISGASFSSSASAIAGASLTNVMDATGATSTAAAVVGASVAKTIGAMTVSAAGTSIVVSNVGAILLDGMTGGATVLSTAQANALLFDATTSANASVVVAASLNSSMASMALSSASTVHLLTNPSPNRTLHVGSQDRVRGISAQNRTYTPGQT